MTMNSFDETSNPEYSNFIALSRYARWLPEKKRRETWDETVDRYRDFWIGRYDWLKDNNDFGKAIQYIKELKIMPSMRALMTAGKALERDEISAFNCAFIIFDRVRAFDEMMYKLMCGVGVGFSVERQFINNLPIVAEELYPSDTTIVVADSRIGWSSSFKELISLLYSGNIPKWDLSKLRPAGAPLKTFGGRASGPDPLEDLFRFTVNTFRNAVGRRLTSLEVHDLACKIGEVVVVGGVRRSACISLSNLSDERMRNAKTGDWWIENPQRALSNNSVCYTEKPEIGTFMTEWLSLYNSRSGERGIFNREAANNQVGKNGRREIDHNWGTNPCSEIILRDRQTCNLSEVVVRAEDTLETLKEKIKYATVLGTLQSTLTNYRYLSTKWKSNNEEERLLGVSLTGIMDHGVLSGSTNGVNNNLPEWLTTLKETAIAVNKVWAKKLDINESTAITAVKPSGTVSSLVDSASGIHPRFAKYYLRAVRADKKDPLAKMMIDAGFPVEDDVTKPDSTCVFYFPMFVQGENAIYRDDRSAIEQLEHWLIYQRYYCEHKPSVTIYVKEHEWLEVGAWVYKHFDEISGIAFLPHTNHVYRQAPFQELTEDEYKKWKKKMPVDVDWSKLGDYEKEDMTKASHLLACTGNVCEIPDLV